MSILFCRYICNPNLCNNGFYLNICKQKSRKLKKYIASHFPYFESPCYLVYDELHSTLPSPVFIMLHMLFIQPDSE